MTFPTVWERPKWHPKKKESRHHFKLIRILVSIHEKISYVILESDPQIVIQVIMDATQTPSIITNIVTDIVGCFSN